MSWLNDLFADGEEEPTSAPPIMPAKAGPATPQETLEVALSPGSNTMLHGGPVPSWERGQNGAGVDNEALREGLHDALATLATAHRGRELELIARLQTALDIQDLDLPPFPDTVIELRGLLDSDGVDSAEISKLVRTDPGLAEEVWRVASSAAMGGRRPKTLRLAVGRLGHRELWKVAMYVALDETLFKVRGFEEEVLFLRQHGTQVADLAEWMAPPKQKGRAWLAGMLHDAGKLLICRIASELSVPNSAPVLPTLMDRCHAPLGALVADSWNMPQVAEAIAHHHGNQDPVGRLVHWADIAAHGAWSHAQDQDPEPALLALQASLDDSFKAQALLDKAIALNAVGSQAA